jgi:hypothetical protein
VPRRKRTGPRRTEVDATKVWQHRRRMEEVVSHYAPSQLTEAAWQQLVEDLIDCVAYAMAGLKGIERGRAPDLRRGPWTTSTAMSAMRCHRQACHPHAPRPAFSRTQSLVKEIAEKFGIPGHDKRGVGNLFMQAQRSQEIEKGKLPDVLIESAPATGELIPGITEQRNRV